VAFDLPFRTKRPASRGARSTRGLETSR
jgi:hypothetical protein